MPLGRSSKRRSCAAAPRFWMVNADKRQGDVQGWGTGAKCAKCAFFKAWVEGGQPAGKCVMAASPAG